MKKHVIKLSLLVISSLIGLSSCGDDDVTNVEALTEQDQQAENQNYDEEVVDDTTKQDPKDYDFLLALSLPTTDLYPFHIVKDVESGVADIKDSQEIKGEPDNVVITSKDGFIYLNSPSKLYKYDVDDKGVLQEVTSVRNTGISGGAVSGFLSDNRLLISTGARAADGGEFEYQIINTDDMSQEKLGVLKLPINTGDKSSPSLFILKDEKVFVPYFHTNSKWAGYDYASIAIYDAKTLEYEKVITTNKAAGLGFSVVASHAFTENGDLYLTSTNTDWWAANESIPSGIVRIKAGEDTFDDYFFNLSEKFGGEHTAGMAYAGNNKAVVQVFKSDLITAYGDYQGGFVIEYYSIDLQTKETKRLNIPLSKWPRKAIEPIGGGKVAIIGNTEKEGNNIYIYDAATDTVTKGLEYTGTETINAILPY